MCLFLRCSQSRRKVSFRCTPGMEPLRPMTLVHEYCKSFCASFRPLTKLHISRHINVTVQSHESVGHDRRTLARQDDPVMHRTVSRVKPAAGERLVPNFLQTALLLRQTSIYTRSSSLRHNLQFIYTEYPALTRLPTLLRHKHNGRTELATAGIPIRGGRSCRVGRLSG
jgi:hypothetical protein